MIGSAVTGVAVPLIGVLMYHDYKKRTEAAKAKQAEAAAKATEIDNINSYAQEWKALYEQRDKRVDELNAKIDLLYQEKEADRQRIRELQEKVSALVQENQALKFKECQVRGCKDRQPPSDY